MNLTEIQFLAAGPTGTLEILRLLPLVMRDIGDVPKNRQRKASSAGGSFNFRGIDDALNYIGPVLVKHAVTPSVQLLDIKHNTVNVMDRNNEPKVLNRSELILAVTFMAADGSWVRNICGGMATDYNDGTSSNKAHSAATKYCYFLGLTVPVERVALEDGDQDEEQGDAANANRYAEQAGHAEVPVTKPGDGKAEELFQTALAAGRNAKANKNVELLKLMIGRAMNNTRFSDEQRNTLVATFRKFAQEIISDGKQKAGAKGAPAQKPPATSQETHPKDKGPQQ